MFSGERQWIQLVCAVMVTFSFIVSLVEYLQLKSTRSMDSFVTQTVSCIVIWFCVVVDAIQTRNKKITKTEIKTKKIKIKNTSPCKFKGRAS